MAAETSLLIIAMQKQGGSKGYGLGRCNKRIENKELIVFTKNTSF